MIFLVNIPTKNILPPVYLLVKPYFENKLKNVRITKKVAVYRLVFVRIYKNPHRRTQSAFKRVSCFLHNFVSVYVKIS